MDSLGVANKKEIIPVNPLLKKLNALENDGENVATYGGIYKKCLFFLCMAVVGIALAVYFKLIGAISVEPVTEELLVEKPVVILLLVAAGVFLIFPFLAFILRVTIPVTGSLYCVSVGFLFGFFAVLDAELGSYIVLAFALTMAIVAVMGILYAKGVIRVTSKFRSITTIAFSAMVLGGLLIFGCSFIPVLRDCVMHLTANPVWNILGSVTGMIIAILFLMVDFDNIRETVENQLPKKYEWYASFGLAFTVVWVYIKVLDLVLQAKK